MAKRLFTEDELLAAMEAVVRGEREAQAQRLRAALGRLIDSAFLPATPSSTTRGEQ
jgi:hypothetical protein